MPTLAEMRDWLCGKALEAAGGDARKAAKMIDVGRMTMYRFKQRQVGKKG